MVQVILGSGGSIGDLLAKELKAHTKNVRLVSRTPVQVNPDDELFKADLLHGPSVERAIEGAEVVYLTVGLKYSLKLWKKQWPLVIDNVIRACIKHNSKLVFFDNVYMYSKDAVPHMTEESERNAPSEKGRVRQEVEKKILDAMGSKGLKALIARSADFYGPKSKNGILNILVLDPLMRGKKMRWQNDKSKVHSFTLTTDAARAVALLGNTDSAFGEVWHLPTSNERWTGNDFISNAAELSRKPAKYVLLSTLLMRVGGLFNQSVAELVEMQYQNTQDYFFDSSKFCEKFDFKPTPYLEGLKSCM